MKFVKSFMIIAIASIFIIACSDDDVVNPVVPDPGLVTINFNALYNGQPLVMNEVIDFDGNAMRINVSEFYISELKLNTESTSVDLGETQYVNFTEGQSTLIFTEVPAANYTSLSFHIGVPADLNQLTPEDFTSAQALSQTSTYWENWKSYIFNKLEGKLDTNGDGETDLIFQYHSGTPTGANFDDLYVKVTVPLTNGLNVQAGDANIVNLAVEHNTLFKNGSTYLDIEAKPKAHNATDIEYPTIILNNFKTGVSVE